MTQQEVMADILDRVIRIESRLCNFIISQGETPYVSPVHSRDAAVIPPSKISSFDGGTTDAGPTERRS